MPKQRLYFKITNRTTDPQTVDLFNIRGMFAAQSGSGSGATYWDMTDELAAAQISGAIDLVLVYTAGSIDDYIVVFYSIGTPITTIEDVIIGLNFFNIGTFTNVGNIVSVASTGRTFSSINITNVAISQHTTDANNGVGGALIFDAGYSLGLIGTFSRISMANSFWKNVAPATNGPFNRTLLYSFETTVSQGFIVNITPVAAKTVYVGLAFSTSTATSPYLAELYVNNNRVIGFDSAADLQALANQVNGQLGTAYTAAQTPYVFWFIFPVELQAGLNLLQYIIQPGAGLRPTLGMEIYDNTKTEIEAATSYADLDLIYSSIDYVGNSLF